MNAFEQYDQLERQDGVTRTITRNVEERHYIWTFADGIPHREVVGGMIRSGAITPILKLPVWEASEGVPEEMRVSVRSNGAEAKYYLPPEPIFRGIMAEYGAWGVTDLTTLVNWDAAAVRGLRVEQVFFPQGVPATYDEIEAQLRNVTLPKENAEVYVSLRNDLLQAVQNARRADTKLVDYNEDCIEKGKTQPGYVGIYTEPSLRAMARLKRQRKDFAITQIADRQNAIVDALPEMIQGLAKQQGSALSPEHLLEFAKVLGSQITEGVKEAIAAAAPKAAPAQPATPAPARR